MVIGAKTLPHEMGHALDLHHTFNPSMSISQCPPQNAQCDNINDGDGVCDTDPNSKSYIYRTGINTCTGIPYNDNTEKNYMSYTP